jgi:hypothetical protein
MDYSKDQAVTENDRNLSTGGWRTDLRFVDHFDQRYWDRWIFRRQSMVSRLNSMRLILQDREYSKSYPNPKYNFLIRSFIKLKNSWWTTKKSSNVKFCHWIRAISAFFNAASIWLPPETWSHHPNCSIPPLLTEITILIIQPNLWHRWYFALRFRETEENHRVYSGSAHNDPRPQDLITVHQQPNVVSEES